jgi:hypothetical protein
MPRGGRRVGAGRRFGSKNRPKLILSEQLMPSSAPPSAKARTDQLRRQICLLVADGAAEDQIAGVVGIGLEKLRACFSRELRFGHTIIRAEILGRIAAAGIGGNVAADRALAQILEIPRDPTIQRPPPPGKKELAQLEGMKPAPEGWSELLDGKYLAPSTDDLLTDDRQ